MSSLLTPDEIAAREAWLEERRSGIGGSDAAAAIGLDPYKDPLTLWSEKLGIKDQDDLSGNEAVEAGNALERTIGEWYARRSGKDVTLGVPFQILRSTRYPWMLATLDGTETNEDGEPGVVQIKNTSYSADAWEEKVPIPYEIQLHHEMLVAGVTRGTIVALHRGQLLRSYERKLSPILADSILAAEARFWSLVESEKPPEPGPLSGEAIKAMFPRSDLDELAALPGEADDLDADLESVKQQIKALESRREAIENQLKLWIGKRAGGVTPQGIRFTWNGGEVYHKPKEASVSYVRRFLRKGKS
jgi:putative phage-type endonuclease